MKSKLIIYIILLLSGSCKSTLRPEASNNVVANQFIDAFYSFDRDSLTSILSDAVESQPEILYYQKWAECGNYQVLNRHLCIEKNDSLVLYPVTVKDDLIGALKLDFNVTDTFHLIITEGHIRSVRTTSNDPDIWSLYCLNRYQMHAPCGIL